MQVNKKYWHSNGKLLISGEYLVLKGATAMAIPINKGQSLEVIESPGKGEIFWYASHKNGKWFEVKLNINELSKNNENSIPELKKLQHILISCLELNPHFLDASKDYSIKTNLEFLPEHGFGSSSTLINNLSKWGNFNPYDLLKKTFGGSGYDIACANTNNPILFKLENNNKLITEVDFNPAFNNGLYFVYLGKKQKSSESINYFNRNADFSESEINRISEISIALSKTDSIENFNELIHEHEQIMSKILKMPTVKSLFFNDLPGSAKSLGAWGGDFAMIGCKLNKTEIKEYLNSKGLTTFYTFKELLVS